MNEISDTLEIAKEYGLLTEVVYTALDLMKQNPMLDPEQALSHAAIDWDIS